jgi:Ser/Thr protein kinase RdoA (MazF antagonist)
MRISGHKLGTPIALGRTAEIYAWGGDQILKLFHEGGTRASVEYEAEIARTVQAAGLSVPAVGEVVEVDGRYGLIYGRVEGRSMLQTFQSKPWTLFRSARLLADLHLTVHARRVPDLPSAHRRLADKIGESGALLGPMADAVLEVLHALPEEGHLLHGDFHPDNVLLTLRGPIIIDWTDATRGHPLADVARTSLLLAIGDPPGTSRRWLVAAGRRRFRAAYLKRYFRSRPAARQQFDAWRLVVAAARLREDIPAERERLLELVESGLQQVRRGSIVT